MRMSKSTIHWLTFKHKLCKLNVGANKSRGKQRRFNRRQYENDVRSKTNRIVNKYEMLNRQIIVIQWMMFGFSSIAISDIIIARKKDSLIFIHISIDSSRAVKSFKHTDKHSKFMLRLSYPLTCDLFVHFYSRNCRMCSCMFMMRIYESTDDRRINWKHFYAPTYIHSNFSRKNNNERFAEDQKKLFTATQRWIQFIEKIDSHLNQLTKKEWVWKGIERVAQIRRVIFLSTPIRLLVFDILKIPKRYDD